MKTLFEEESAATACHQLLNQFILKQHGHIWKMFSFAIRPTIAIEYRTYRIYISVRVTDKKSIFKQNKYYKVSQLNCYSYTYIFTLEII